MNGYAFVIGCFFVMLGLIDLGCEIRRGFERVAEILNIRMGK